MQISPRKNPNFEKPSRNLSNRTKVKIKRKKFLDISQKNLCSTYAQSHRKCSNIEILAKIEGKEAKKIVTNFRRAYKDLIQVKKKIKIISCLCTFKIVKYLSKILRQNTLRNKCVHVQNTDQYSKLLIEELTSVDQRYRQNQGMVWLQFSTIPVEQGGGGGGFFNCPNFLILKK